MNQTAVEALGFEPLTPFVQEIEAVQNHDELTRLLGRMNAQGVNSPFGLFTDNDAFDSSRLMVYLWQGGSMVRPGRKKY